jgi:hypothetical protein
MQKTRITNMAETEDLIGMRFGKLTVVAYQRHEKNMSFWLCRCDCGNEKSVRRNSLTQYKISSCGCGRKAAMQGFKTTRARV